MKMYRIIEIKNHPFIGIRIGIDNRLNLILIEGDDAIKKDKDLVPLIQALDIVGLDVLSKAVIDAREKFN